MRRGGGATEEGVQKKQNSMAALVNTRALKLKSKRTIY